MQRWASSSLWIREFVISGGTTDQQDIIILTCEHFNLIILMAEPSYELEAGYTVIDFINNNYSQRLR